MNSLSEFTEVAPIRVYLLIENRLLREALARILRKCRDLLIAGESGRTEATHQSISEIQCDVFVVDMFDPGWLPQCFEIESEIGLRCKVLLIGMSDDPQQFLGAVRRGISGYVLRDASAQDIVEAVRGVFRGEAYCPPRLCLKLFQCVSHLAWERPLRSPTASLRLTLRQQKLVDLVGQGLTNKEIASSLNLSEFTIRNHLHRIMKRLKASNRREAVEAVRAHVAYASECKR